MAKSIQERFWSKVQIGMRHKAMEYADANKEEIKRRRQERRCQASS